uniref:ANK_REP_REGION domain-containing protein n=1 Tax=Panagrellus redivivus TaxID=6233 RepID=A0A7E4UVD1_PANRE
MPRPVKRPYRLLSSDSEDEFDVKCSPPSSENGFESTLENYTSAQQIHIDGVCESKPSPPLVALRIPPSARDPRPRRAEKVVDNEKPKMPARSCLKNTISIEKFVELVANLDYPALSRLNEVPIDYFMPDFEDGETILHKLVVVNEPAVVDIVKLLVERFGAPINLLSHDGESLINAAIRTASQDAFGNWKNEMIDALINLNCDVNFEAMNGERPLFVAYKMGNIEAAVWLVMCGANPANVVAFEHRLTNTSVPTKLREMIRDRFIELDNPLFASGAHLIPASVTVYPTNPEAKLTVRFSFDENDVPVMDNNFVYVLEVRLIEFAEPRNTIHLSTSNDVIVESASAHYKQLSLVNPKIINAFDVSSVLRCRPATTGRGKRMFSAEMVLAKDIPSGQNLMAVVMRYQTAKASY